jgi:hypothetical protein
MSIFYKPTACQDCGGAGEREVKSFSEGGKITTLICNRCDGDKVDPENTEPRWSYPTVAVGGILVGWILNAAGFLAWEGLL